MKFILALCDQFFFSCSKVLSGKASLNSTDMELDQSQGIKKPHKGGKTKNAVNEAEPTMP